jgi:hypothetical protein
MAAGRRARRGSGSRKLDAEGGAVACPAHRGDRASVRLDDGASDRQPEPHSLLLRAEKRLEDLRQVLRVDARAAVVHADDDRMRIGLQRERDGATVVRQRAHRVHRVEHQVDQHLLQLHRIAEHHGRSVRRTPLQHDAAPARLRLEQQDDLVDHRTEVDGLVQRLVPGEQPRSRRITSLARRSSRRMRVTMRSRSSRRFPSPGASARRRRHWRGSPERLVDLVGDRRRELSRDRQARCVRELAALFLDGELGTPPPPLLQDQATISAACRTSTAAMPSTCVR